MKFFKGKSESVEEESEGLELTKPEPGDPESLVETREMCTSCGGNVIDGECPGNCVARKLVTR